MCDFQSQELIKACHVAANGRREILVAHATKVTQYRESLPCQAVITAKKRELKKLSAVRRQPDLVPPTGIGAGRSPLQAVDRRWPMADGSLGRL